MTPTSRELRQFGITVGIAFGLLALLIQFRGSSRAALVIGALGAMLLVLGVLLPRSLVIPHRLWMALAHALSRVTTPVFMAIVYFLVLTPTGLVMRAFGRNPLRSRGWVVRGAGERRSDLRRQF